MEAAIWAVIGGSLLYLAGTLLAIYIVMAVYIALLESLRIDRWAIFAKKWVMRGAAADK